MQDDKAEAKVLAGRASSSSAEEQHSTVTPLVKLLGSSSLEVQEVAAQTLWCLAALNDSNAKVVGEGAIPPLVKLL